MKSIDRTQLTITGASIKATLLMRGLTAEWLGLPEEEGYINTDLFKRKLNEIEVKRASN